MTSRLSQRATSILAALAIILLLAFLIFLWTGVQHGLFKTTRHKTIVSAAPDEKANDTLIERHYEFKSQEGRAKTFLQSEMIGIGKEVEYVKPIKISPLPLHEHDIIYDQSRRGDKEAKPQMRHHSGHFRHHATPLWDPHPEYKIDAFGKTFHLALVHNSKFVSPDLQMSHIWANDTSKKIKSGIQTDGCFYSGRVKGDEHSSVAVSLCNGMTGYIRTNEDTYYIEPAEHFNETRSILHAIHKQPRSGSEPSRHRPCATLTDDNLDQVFSNDLLHNEDTSVSEEKRNRTKRNSEWQSRKILTSQQIYHYNNFDEPEIEKNPLLQIRSRYYERDHQNNKYPPDDYDYRSKSSDYQNVNGDDVVYMEPGSFEDLNHGPIGSENRRKREDGQEYYIEIMIVADKSMTDTHKTEENLTHYILTLMSHVALLFKDPTIGNPITISVSGIHTLDKYFDGNGNKESSKRRLTDFCNWQTKRNFSHRYDTAMILTRLNICPSECNTLGIANIDSMCNKMESCSVVKDKGLSTSFTIAHELGHMLSMPHDQDLRCSTRFPSISRVNKIMTQMMDNDTVPWLWSNCSRHYLTEFLDSPRSHCLTNIPTLDMLAEQDEVDRLLPGEAFSRIRQCELNFGKGWSTCDPEVTSCGMLSCMKESDGSCHTPFVPWADGTPCGDGRLCHRGKCVPMDAKILTPVMGGWSEYQPWSECSLSCGGGIRKSQRECDNPRPAHGGKYCVGRPVRYESCNIEPCSASMDTDIHHIHDIREKQCAKWNGNNRGIPGIPFNVIWVPKYGVSHGQECKLYCRVEHSSEYFALEQKVIDGAKCQLDGSNVCVNGICMQAGCDNILGSNTSLDRCGECGGDGSHCVRIRGDVTNSEKYGYNEVIRIPQGSRGIEILQHSWNGSQDENYLVLKDSETGEYIINGNSHLVRQKIIVYGGIKIEYSGFSSVIERLNSSVQRPLQKDLIVEVLTFNSKYPPNIKYQYTIPKSTSEEYGWILLDEWTKCSDLCEGQRSKRTVCIQKSTNHKVSPAHCSHTPEPSGHVEDCNLHCQLRWEVTSKDDCSAHCGKGERRIHYQCVMTDREMKTMNIHNSHCDRIPPVSQIEHCTGPCNETHWKYGNWSQCSVTCGKGSQIRSATCVDKNDKKVKPDRCTGQEKFVQRYCDERKCPSWAVDKWTPCSVTCGIGYKSRLYYCQIGNQIVSNDYCDKEKLQPIKMICKEKPCTRWYISEWKKCSVSCGRGIVVRDVYCTNTDGQQIDDSSCNEINRPDTFQNCELVPCPREKNIRVFDMPTTEIDNSILINQQSDKDYTWRTRSWQQCTKTCGGGIKKRVVFCLNENGEEVMTDFCNEKMKPVDKVECNKDPCPTWQSASWSKCDSNCYKNRQVRCQNHEGQSLADNYCSNRNKPTHAELCSRDECTLNQNKNVIVSQQRPPRKYRWLLTSWRPCSKSCGQGVRERSTYCVDTNDQKHPDQYCSHLKKPKLTRRGCFKKPCPGYAWIEGPWSKCSAPCGNGTQTRAITCNKVNELGYTDEVSNEFCNQNNMPITNQSCKKRNCNDIYYWDEGPWKNCMPVCGRKRKQERHIYCYHRDGKKVRKIHCPKETKPARRRKCVMKLCPLSSCKIVQEQTGSRIDREYWINVHGINVSIFCHNMKTNDPQEYLTLHVRNYAEFYEKRLSNPNTCPYNGQRPGSRCDACRSDTHGGFTIFKRIRLNIDTLQVITDDFTFTNQQKGRPVNYGKAGDCYSTTSHCPQGQFEINLQGTGFKVAQRTTWKKNNELASADIRKESLTRILGRCGGHCSYCEPDPSLGLTLEVT